jgi:hypothetical protein
MTPKHPKLHLAASNTSGLEEGEQYKISPVPLTIVRSIIYTKTLVALAGMLFIIFSESNLPWWEDFQKLYPFHGMLWP